MLQKVDDCLWARIVAAGQSAERYIADDQGQGRFDDHDGGTMLGCDIGRIRGRSVLLAGRRQLAIAFALAEIDGMASRMILCPPDFLPADVPGLVAETGVDFVISDRPDDIPASAAETVPCGQPVKRTGRKPVRDQHTEWWLFTSGTTGKPKQVVHTLQSLTAPIGDDVALSRGAIWGTFYDIRRYGGLQILLRALIGGGSMVVGGADEPVGEYMMRAGAAGVTHMSGTPSHWRRALMSGSASKISPRYIRLSGEVADQAILNQLREYFPAASIAHAFASTEAGVAFDVRDGLAGFPEGLIGQTAGDVQMRVEDGTLRIRSSRLAQGYRGEAPLLIDAEGFVDTSDMVELRDGRYYFIGRREGLINVGGLKVHPEEIEAVVNLHPAVQMSCAYGRRNPITGAIVVANVVIRPEYKAKCASLDDLKREILAACRQALPPYKVPSMLYEVPSMELSASGKLLRPHA